MKTIKIVTLVVPFVGGCQLLDWMGSPQASLDKSQVAPAIVEAPPSAAPVAGDPVQLRTDAALAAEAQLSREDVRLETRFGDAAFRSEQARAIGGDANAAMRVAKMYAEGSNGVPRDEHAMVLWLKHASLLDHGGASYQLYLYYLARGLDRDALRYERRAVRQGYTLPVRLDQRRG